MAKMMTYMKNFCHVLGDVVNKIKSRNVQATNGYRDSYSDTFKYFTEM